MKKKMKKENHKVTSTCMEQVSTQCGGGRGKQGQAGAAQRGSSKTESVSCPVRSRSERCKAEPLSSGVKAFGKVEIVAP